VLLDDVQDPGNAGSIIRSASAMGYDGILMTEKCVDPFSPKCVKASAGSVLSIWIRRSDYCREMVKALIKNGYTMAAADMKGTPVDIASVVPPLILALGNEGAGISDFFLKMASITICVPINENGAESLNVAAAGAICMYELSDGMRKKTGLCKGDAVSSKPF
jgi:TrmH family RNA methyltransferase